MTLEQQIDHGIRLEIHQLYVRAEVRKLGGTSLVFGQKIWRLSFAIVHPPQPIARCSPFVKNLGMPDRVMSNVCLERDYAEGRDRAAEAAVIPELERLIRHVDEPHAVRVFPR